MTWRGVRAFAIVNQDGRRVEQRRSARPALVPFLAISRAFSCTEFLR